MHRPPFLLSALISESGGGSFVRSACRKLNLKTHSTRWLSDVTALEADIPTPKRFVRGRRGGLEGVRFRPGTNTIDRFAKMTKLEFHVEGPVGQFALGRGKKQAIAS
jgi:hypothetical protein